MASKAILPLLVAGGRLHHLTAAELAVLEAWVVARGFNAIVQGGASGVDADAANWATRRDGMTVLTFHADWYRYGAQAGPIRNARMVAEVRRLGGAALFFTGGAETESCRQTAAESGLEILDPRGPEVR